MNAPETLLPEKIGVYADGADLRLKLTDILAHGVTRYIRSDLIPRWVSVKEEEPEDTEDFCDEFVVLFDIVDGGGTGYLGTAEFVEGEWFPPASSQRVTHWLKGVPPIPKEK